MSKFTFKEEDLEIEIKSATHARKFDDSSHGLSHCMKAVDFIVERPDHFLFIEFKDPQKPGSNVHSQSSFKNRFLRGTLDQSLKYKYRDSFLYEWAEGRAQKPIDYLVLIALDSLTSAELLTRTDDLKRNLPLQKSKASPWPRPFVRNCAVFNISSWNSNFSDLTVTRLSTKSQSTATT